MKKVITQILIWFFAILAVGYPLWTRFSNMPLELSESITSYLFPFFGLLMVSLLWLHSLLGALEDWLRKYIPFDLFVQATAAVILISLIAHPLLLLISVNFSIKTVYAIYSMLFVWLGILSWTLLISYDVIKPFRKFPGVSKHWDKVLFISNLGFLLSFFHSLNIGSDLQAQPLRGIWIFYGVTGAVAILYTYVIKPLRTKWIRNNKT